MPAWRRTHLHPGLYDKPVSERLAHELEKLGPQAHIAQLPKGPTPTRAWRPTWARRWRSRCRLRPATTTTARPPGRSCRTCWR